MPNSPTDSYEPHAAGELAILEGVTANSETLDKGLATLDEMKEAVAKAGLAPQSLSFERTRRHGFTFGIGDDALELRFVPTDVRFGLTVTPEGGEGRRVPFPLVYDPISKTFVGEELEPDIGLAPNQHRPRKTALKVFVEVVRAAVGETPLSVPGAPPTA